MTTPRVGARIRVWWDADEAWFSGTVTQVTRSRGHLIKYDAVEGEDDLVQWTNLDNETYEDLDAAGGGGASSSGAQAQRGAKKGRAVQPPPPPPPPPSSKAAGKKRAAPSEALAAPAAALSSKAAGKKRAEPPRNAPQARSKRANRGRGAAGGGDDDADGGADGEDDAAIAAAIAAADAEEAAQNGEGEATAIDLDDAPAARAAAAGSSSAHAGRTTGARDDDDAEVEYVQHVGDLALVDFPHARHNCALHAFTPGAEAKHCPNCFCFVCDVEASKCPEWSTGACHCKATHDSQEWIDLRNAARAKANGGGDGGAGVAGEAAGGAGGAGSSKMGGGAPSGQPWQPRPVVQRWSCDELLEKAQQVYPREEPEPPSLLGGTVLRPYQKQSIAFMLDVERSTDAAQASIVHNRGAGASTVRGGWLADEVGMGKTMVVTCVVLAAPAADLKPISDQVFHKWLTAVRTPPAEEEDDDAEDADADGGGFASKLPAGAKAKAAGGVGGGGGGKGKGGKKGGGADEAEPTLDFKLTMVVVNNTLVQQWEDEIRKFAPSLRVHKFYATAANKEAALRNLRACDILLTTPHMINYAKGLPKRLLAKMRVHRLVVDEAHLMGERGNRGVSERLMMVQTSRTWLVSGTPFSTSLDQLERQACLLGCRGWGDWGGDLRILGLRGRYRYESNRSPHLRNEAIGDWLRTRMIRHTKRMRIGDVALALPDADAARCGSR